MTELPELDYEAVMDEFSVLGLFGKMVEPGVCELRSDVGKLIDIRRQSRGSVTIIDSLILQYTTKQKLSKWGLAGLA